MLKTFSFIPLLLFHLHRAGRCLHIFFVITRAAAASSCPQRKWLISVGICISQTPRSRIDDRWTLTSHVSWTYRQNNKETLTLDSFLPPYNTADQNNVWGNAHKAQTFSAVQMLPPVSPRMQKGWDSQTAGVGGQLRRTDPVGKPRAGRHTTTAAYLLNVGFERLSTLFIETRF